MLCSIASSVVYTQRPGNHVAKQGNQEQQCNSGDENTIFFSSYSGDLCRGSVDDNARKRALKAVLVLFCYEGKDTSPLPHVLQNFLSHDQPSGRVPDIAIFIGSEGGFSPEEVAAAIAHGCTPIGLGPRILRTETASSFVLACLVYALEL